VPNRRTEAQYWIRKNYGKTIKFVDQKKEYTISIQLLPEYITIYSTKLNEFIVTSLSDITAI